MTWQTLLHRRVPRLRHWLRPAVVRPVYGWYQQRMWLPAGHKPVHPRFLLRQWSFVANDPVAQTLQATMVADGVA
eukprot:11205102-Lingulodinium_polyedra.AAC.1